MLISALSTATGVSVATLKYYLREGLLMPGRTTSATRATYAEEHVARVRLIRALADIGGMSLASIKQVVTAIENPPPARIDLVAAAHDAIRAPGLDHAVDPEAVDLVERLGWRVDPTSAPLRSLSAALEAARDAGVAISPARLTTYARACQRIADADVRHAAAAATPTETVITVVAGTVLVDPVLAALRRLAQQHVSADLLT